MFMFCMISIKLILTPSIMYLWFITNKYEKRSQSNTAEQTYSLWIFNLDFLNKYFKNWIKQTNIISYLYFVKCGYRGDVCEY
jgi:hypothetical protein